jgi:LysM repeat protein
VPRASPAYDDQDEPAAVSEEESSEPELIPSAPLTDEDADPIDSVAPVPAFLAGRSARANQPPPKVDDKITREEVVPSWELTDRYGAQSGGRPERGSSDDGTFSKVLTAVAVIIILALGIAAVVLIPGLLNGPGATSRPTLALASRTPGSSVVGVVATPTAAPATPTVTAEPTPEITPGPTPRFYRVKAGDTLNKIARRFKVTVAAIQEANPEIGAGDHIEVGQILIIPPRQPN